MENDPFILPHFLTFTLYIFIHNYCQRELYIKSFIRLK